MIELKVSRGYDRVIGQLLRYMAWVENNMQTAKPVRGIIVAKEITDDLKLAASRISGVKLIECPKNSVPRAAMAQSIQHPAALIARISTRHRKHPGRKATADGITSRIDHRLRPHGREQLSPPSFCC